MVSFNFGLPVQPRDRMIGAFNGLAVRVITLNIAVRLRFFHDAIFRIVFKRQRRTLRRRHDKQTPQNIVTISGCPFRRMHRGHAAGGIVLKARDVAHRIPFFHAVTVAIIRIVPLRAGIVGFGDHPPVGIQRIAIAFALRVNDFNELQAVRVITILPAMAFPIHTRHR
ncbi:hypothetical protein Xedl_03932 [Xenorhabdus eapokensis]|uniref:Uncharacterized protein n=1 Tax=Xenorhabdus eapokensis TaxID=1873482 RepID=A0A1Q5TBI8_9GAMM|nr:hypothetical protein Xedl_03932 [Xenorhabdus eapokensis]